MKKILIVEDDGETLEQIEEIVKEQGFITITAMTQKQAMKIIDSDESLPDLAFLDIGLPDNKEGGIEIAKAILKIKHIPIVFVTNKREYYSDVLQKLGSQIIEKGFTDNQIIDALAISLKQNDIPNTEEISVYSDGKLVFNTEIPEGRGSHGHYIVSVKDICYVKGVGNKSRIMLSDNRLLEIGTEKSVIESYLKKAFLDYDNYFMHKHNSYIINQKKVKAYNSEKIWFEGVAEPILYNKAKDHLDEFLVVYTRKK